MTTRARDYFLQEDHYQPICVEIMQACGNNIITIELDTVGSILIQHQQIYLYGSILQYFVTFSSGVIKMFVRDIELDSCTQKLIVSM